MAALTASRDTHRKDLGVTSYPVAAATTIYKGGMVALNSGGYLVAAADTAGLLVVGAAAENVDNSAGANGALSAQVRRGKARFNASSITQAMVGQIMYVVDDNTFDETTPANSVIAGILDEYVGATDGWLIIAPEIGAENEAGLTALGVTASAAELNVLDGVTAGTVTASKGVVVDASKNIGDFNNLDAVNLDAGASGTAGSIDVFPATALKGKLTLAVTDQTGDTAVTLQIDAMGQATAVHVPDPGAAAGYLVMTTAALALAEADVLQGAVAGTLTASKAVVVDASSRLDALNATAIDAGYSGAAGSIDVFPTTALKGKLTLAVTDQTGDTAVTLQIDAMGQATAVHVPDPGAAASYVVQSAASRKALLAGSATWDPASILDGGFAAQDFTVTGAVLGDFVLASAPVDVVDVLVSAQVTAANTVTVTIQNETGGAVDLATGTWRVLVIPYD